MSRQNRLALALASVLLLPGTPAIAQNWSLEVVDASGNVGRGTSLVFESSGNPVVAYFDMSHDALRLATKSGGAWSIETVDPAAGTGVFSTSSMAFDHAGTLHICYYDHVHQDLKYAFRTSGVWQVGIVVSNGGTGIDPSLAIDAQDRLHVAYLDGTQSKTMYAVLDQGSWSIQPLDSTGTGFTVRGLCPSLALGPDGQPHIAYFRDFVHRAEYATKTQGRWKFETIAASMPGGNLSCNAIALDPSGTPYVCYNTYANPALKFNRRDPGGWTSLDTFGNSSSPTLLIDANGIPHAAFGFELDGARYAERRNGTWVTERITDSQGTMTSPNDQIAMALDPQGVPCVAFYDGTHLTYASRIHDGSVPVRQQSWGDIKRRFLTR